jgi:hypothetical protein
LTNLKKYGIINTQRGKPIPKIKKKE